MQKLSAMSNKLPASSNLPEEFVYIQDIDPTIQINLKYAGTDNFIGQAIGGYFNSKAAILTKKAALALSDAQKQFNKQGFSIVLYDAYRPQQSVDNIVDWTQNLNDQKMKEFFYPRIEKNILLDSGYLARQSSHSRGSTVDLTIIPLHQQLSNIAVPVTRQLQDGFKIYYLNDGTVDMGTSFDLFDEASHGDSLLVNLEHKKQREFLADVMVSCGFYGFHKEWWHFTLENEPYLDKYWDFVVQ